MFPTKSRSSPVSGYVCLCFRPTENEELCSECFLCMDIVNDAAAGVIVFKVQK